MIDASQITVTRNFGTHVAARVNEGRNGVQSWVLAADVARQLGLDIPEQVSGHAWQPALWAREIYAHPAGVLRRVPFWRQMDKPKRGKARRKR